MSTLGTRKFNGSKRLISPSMNAVKDIKSYKAYMGGPLSSMNTKSQILIVDDNMFNLTSLQTMIRMKFNINSTVCSSGEISLQFI